MKKLFKLFIITIITMIFLSCTKKVLTLDETTSMKTILNAKDSEITELIIKEAKEKGDISEEDIKVEYIIKDKKNEAIAVKLNIIEK